MRKALQGALCPDRPAPSSLGMKTFRSVHCHLVSVHSRISDSQNKTVSLLSCGEPRRHSNPMPSEFNKPHSALVLPTLHSEAARHPGIPTAEWGKRRLEKKITKITQISNPCQSRRTAAGFLRALSEGSRLPSGLGDLESGLDQHPELLPPLPPGPKHGTPQLLLGVWVC